MKQELNKIIVSPVELKMIVKLLRPFCDGDNNLLNVVSRLNDISNWYLKHDELGSELVFDLMTDSRFKTFKQKELFECVLVQNSLI